DAGIIDGVGNNTLAPRNNATRAQVAAMLMRFDQLG
ncbi:MAG TPA: S-layer homology domain-containing protein, partial [Candidatus Faecousia faecigallinarum]|nr:S-layer homology domain-containing protein [Candidatus Faecousia faecigallinarum]